MHTVTWDVWKLPCCVRRRRRYLQEEEDARERQRKTNGSWSKTEKRSWWWSWLRTAVYRVAKRARFYRRFYPRIASPRGRAHTEYLWLARQIYATAPSTLPLHRRTRRRRDVLLSFGFLFFCLCVLIQLKSRRI